MSYRFNTLKGGVVKVAQGLGQGLKPLKPSGGEIVYGPGFHPVQVSSEAVVRGGAATLDRTLLSNYKKFQKPEAVPVHLKGGQRDRLLTMFTFILTGVGVFESFRFFYRASFPQRPEE